MYAQVRLNSWCMDTVKAKFDEVHRNKLSKLLMTYMKYVT